MLDVALNLSVRVEDAGWQDKLPKLQKKMIQAVETALLSQHKLKLKYPSYEIALVLTSNRDMQKLNKQHRGKDYATNVLSFPLETEPSFPDMPVMLGDIIIAHDVVELEAKTEKKTFNNHFLHLVVHGTLHICGYDHETNGQARTMERLEREILADMNIPDPYALK